MAFLGSAKFNMYPIHPNHAAALATGYRLNKVGDAVTVKGCGMDVGWHFVTQTLSHALYGKANTLKQVWL